MKTQSLNDRARMHPVNVYGEMVKEVPLDLLEQPASFNYFGSSTHMLLTQKRRELNNMRHDSSNTTAVENDQYFVNDAKADMYDADVDLSVRGYREHIEQGNNRNVKWRLNNYPYNWPGQGASRLWDELVEADNMHGVLDWQGDVLPTSLLRSVDLKTVRNTYFNDYGLYKVRPYPFSTFLEYGAKVFTCGYFCKKGYTEDITVKTDVSSYDYDFRKKGLIVTPDTKSEVDFIFNCFESENYDWSSAKISKSFLNSKSMKIKDNTIFSFNKDKTFKHPIVIKLKNNGSYTLGYTSSIVDDSINFDKVIIPYQCSSFASGGTDIGNVISIPAGIQLMPSYRYTKVTEQTSDVIVKYLTSLPVKYLINEWRTSQTHDGHQLNVIKKLTDFTVETDDDILEFLGGTDIKKEIENGYARKTGQK